MTGQLKDVNDFDKKRRAFEWSLDAWQADRFADLESTLIGYDSEHFENVIFAADSG